MTAQSMGRFAMAIEATEDSRSVRPRRGRARQLAYLAAGVLALSAVGYHMVEAPSSTAAATSECKDGKGKVTIKAKGDSFVGTAELTDRFTNFDDNEDCVDTGANGTSGPIKSTESADGKSCVLTAKVDKANGQAPDGAETTEAGDIEVTVPLDGGPAQAKASGNNDNGEQVTATAVINGLQMSDCTTIPTGTFTATKVNASIEK